MKKTLAEISSSISATEWLEADGLGGFASGTVGGANSRRYHAILLVAEHPPADRHVLVNDVVVSLETPNGTRRLSRHTFLPNVTTDMDATITTFAGEPWPTWTYELDGVRVEREIIALHGLPIVLNRFRFERAIPGARFSIRPLLSGRDFHALHRENPAFDFTARVSANAEKLQFRPYPSVTGVLSLANGTFRSAPEWYRNVLYEAERDRGLDYVEDLASPGVIEFALDGEASCWVVAADTPEVGTFVGERSAAVVAADIVARESARRARFSNPLERAGDAYLVRRGEGKTIIAGYPWFGDWGRDTFIALRGLCLALGRFAEARDILKAWGATLSLGMLPNRFADRADEAPEYNSVDAALWYVLAVGELLASESRVVSPADRASLLSAVEGVIEGYSQGTRYGIRLDADGLLMAGGVSLGSRAGRVGGSDA